MTATTPPSGWRRLVSGPVLRALLSLALIVAIFVFAFPKVADLGEVYATVRAMTWLEVATLAVGAIWNLVTYWFVMMMVLPGLSLRHAMMANMTGGAISNTLPAGGAIAVGMTYAMYASWGFSSSQIGLSVLVSGVWNNFVKLGLPVVALALLAVQGQAGPGLVSAALVGVVVLVAAVTAYALMLRSPTFARRLGDWLGRTASWLRRLVRRPPVEAWGDGAVRVRDETVDLVHGRWPLITAASLLSHLSLFVVLLLALRHVGVTSQQVSWVEALGAFAFMRLLSAVPITPGGLGVVELGLTAALVVAGGPRAPVVAAVLVYRALTWLPTLPAGVVTYAMWRWEQRGRVVEPVRPPEAVTSDVEVPGAPGG
jgi:uncharacterized membrane protein YbhN (UPF0104 family)